MIITSYVGALVLLFVLAVPVAFALAGTSILVTFDGARHRLQPGLHRAEGGVPQHDNFMLLLVSFLISTTPVINISSITVRIYAFAKSLVGAVRGGLAQVNVIAERRLRRHDRRRRLGGGGARHVGGRVNQLNRATTRSSQSQSSPPPRRSGNLFPAQACPLVIYPLMTNISLVRTLLSSPPPFPPLMLGQFSSP